MSGKPGGSTDILNVDSGDAKIFSIKPFHLFAFRLIDAGKAQAPSKEPNIIFAVDVSEPEYSIAQSGALPYFFTFRPDFLQRFFGEEFVFCEFEPRFGGRGFRAAACCDYTRRRRLVYHARAELYVGRNVTAGAFTSQGGGQREGARGVYGVFLGVVSLAAAIEDVGKGTAGREGEDFGKGFYKELYQWMSGRKRGEERLRSRLASACMNLSVEQASENSGASQASWGRTLSTRRTSEARLFW